MTMLGLRMRASPWGCKFTNASCSRTVDESTSRLASFRGCDFATLRLYKFLVHAHPSLAQSPSTTLNRMLCLRSSAMSRQFGARRRCPPRPDRRVSPTVALSPKHPTACSSGTTFATTSRPATLSDFSLLAVFCLVAFTAGLSPVAICQPTHRCSRLRAFASRSLPTGAPLLRPHIL